MQPDGQESEEIEVYFAELYRLMWAMVWDYVNPERMRLQPDEIFAELSLELVKVIKTYSGNGRSHVEVTKIAKTCLRNRCADLYVMEYKTYRRAESMNVSLDECDEDELDLMETVPSDHGNLSVYELLDGLSEDAKELALLVLHPNDNLIRQLQLAVIRKEFVAPKRCWQLELMPHMLQRALGWNGTRFDNAWQEIKIALDSG